MKYKPEPKRKVETPVTLCLPVGDFLTVYAKSPALCLDRYLPASCSRLVFD